MARIRRWKEKLLLAWFTLFASVTWARPRMSAAEGGGRASHSWLVTGSGGKRALGIAFSAGKPFVQILGASLAPVALPAAVGAFTASAGAANDPAGARGRAA